MFHNTTTQPRFSRESSLSLATESLNIIAECLSASSNSTVRGTTSGANVARETASQARRRESKSRRLFRPIFLVSSRLAERDQPRGIEPISSRLGRVSSSGHRGIGRVLCLCTILVASACRAQWTMRKQCVTYRVGV